MCVSIIPNQNLWSESVQGGSDPITDRVMDRSVVQRVGFPSCGAGDPEDRGDPAGAVPGVPGKEECCRQDHSGATPGAGGSEGQTIDGGRRPCVQ